MSRLSCWLATLGPVGHWRWGPGTLASAIAAAGWLVWRPSLAVWIGLIIALAVVGAVVSDLAERVFGPDDGRIVIDEAAGQALALIALPASVGPVMLGFLAFRLLDIVKPPPIRRLQRFHGGIGIMLDDLVAGGLVAIVSLAVGGVMS